MKGVLRLFALLVFVQTAFAVQAYTLESARYGVEMIVGLTGGQGTIQAHVPFPYEMQTVEQLSSFGLASDGIGQYFSTSAPAVFRAEVYVDASKIKINSNPELPLSTAGVPVKYMQPTAKIESTDPEIEAKAVEIKGNNTTELEIVTDIIAWVHENVKYKLVDDLVGKNSAKGVLSKKEGVCGDFSVLAAAFLRSLGIPVKYVNGLLYTDSGTQLHAWLEYYVPGSGWIPADPTNGKAMPDASLIKIREGADPAELADNVTYRMNPQPIFTENTSAKLLESTEWHGRIIATVEINPKSVGENSHTQAKITLENLKGFYQVPFLKVFLTSGLKTKDAFMFAVLAPYEKVIGEIDIQTPGNLSKGYTYTHFAQIAGPGINATDSFVISDGGPVYSKGYIAIKSIERGVGGSSIRIRATLENGGNADANVSVSLISDNGTDKKTAFIAAGQAAQVDFEVGRESGRYLYNFTILAETSGSVTVEPIYIQIKEEAIFENVEQFFSDNIWFFVTGALTLIVLIIGFLFLSPYIHEPKKPFKEGRGVKIAGKKIFEEEI